MRICNCQHPKFILSPSTGERLRVRCGKCSTCLNSKAKNWINRLQLEYQNSMYAFMVNLTYDDVYLPKLYLDDSGTKLVFKDNRKDDGFFVPLDELMDLCNNSQDPERETDYFLDRLNHRLGIPFCYIKDIQDFNKRLNKYFHDHVTGTYQNFRYFTATELGPGTYRPHSHGAYFVQDQRVSANFEKAVFACWSFGDCSAAAIYSNGGLSYVASYINMSTHLPAIYAHNSLKTKHVFSKCPPIGSPSFLAEEVRDVYDRLPINRVIYDSISGKYVTLPANNTFKNRYFPKCEGYSTGSDSYRIKLYRLVEIFPSTDFREFCDEIYSVWYHYRTYGKLEKEIYKDLIPWFSSLHMDTKEVHKVEAKIYRAYLVSSRFCYITDLLGTSHLYTLRKIDEFYKKLDYERLKDQFKFQQDYTVMHDVVDLVNMYPDLCYTVRGANSFQDLSPEYQLALHAFGIDYLTDFPSVTSSFDFKSMAFKHDSIYKDTHKAHDVNNYRYSKKFNRSDPELQKIILKYAEK